MSKSSGIYIIKSTRCDKIYIGSAVAIKDRWSYHKHHLLNKKHDNSHLQRFVDKYGFDCLVFEILEECSKEMLLIREQHYIDTLKPKFNICMVAGNTLGKKLSLEARRKIAAKAKGRRWTEERRKAFSIFSTGRKMSDETKKKIGLASTGRKLPAESIKKGVEKRKQTMSLPGRKQVLSEAHKQSLIRALKGVPKSKEAIEKAKATKKFNYNLRLAKNYGLV